jgi:hypothetical protein
MNFRVLGFAFLGFVSCTSNSQSNGSGSQSSGNQANNAQEEVCDCSNAQECTRLACGWCACQSSSQVCTRNNVCAALDTNSVNAADSVLQLTLVDTPDTYTLPEARVGKVRKTVRVMYNPPEGSSVTFRMADIAVAVSKEAVLLGAFEGDSLIKTGKSLYVDPATQKPWQKITPSGGATEFRVLVLSMENPDYVKKGVLYDLVFELPQGGKVAFWFKDASSILAPAGANSVLKSTYNVFLKPLVVAL